MQPPRMEPEKKLSSRTTTKTNCVSKTAFFKTKAGKCHRPSSTLHRNPYLNFLREFRIRNCGLSPMEIIRRGAQEWNNMSKEEKRQYIEEAFYAPKKRKPPPQQPPQLQQAQMRMVSTCDEDCGIVCPRMNACGKKRRRRKSKCARRRRPKKRSCGKKRRPKRRSRGCRKKRRSCRI